MEPAGFPPAKLEGAVPLDILLVEDEASDALLTEHALMDARVECTLHVLEDGQWVLPYLRRQGQYRRERTPDLLLLDLSLPGKDGFELLADLAEQSATFRDLPIVILTGDTHCAFLRRSYGLNIAAYLIKPCTPAKINAALGAIRRH